jgi:hypothetical protein
MASAILPLSAAVAAELPVKIVNNPLDVMSGQQPKLPQFPKLQRKAGTIRGYVQRFKRSTRGRRTHLVIAPAMWGYGTGTNASGRTNATWPLRNQGAVCRGAGVVCRSRAHNARRAHGVAAAPG